MTLDEARRKATELAFAPPPSTEEEAAERREMIREIAAVFIVHGAVEELGEDDD